MGQVVRVSGERLSIADLDAAMADVVAVGKESLAIVVALEREVVVAALLSGTASAGDPVRRGGPLTVPCGPAVHGRTIDPAGQVHDGAGSFHAPRRLVNGRAPGIAQRQPASRRVSTGVKALDLLYPTLAGDRVLFTGPRSERATELVLLVQVYATSLVDTLPLAALDRFDAELLAQARQAKLQFEADRRPNEENVQKVRHLAAAITASLRQGGS